MTLWAAVVAALAASVCGAMASTLQHRTAVAVVGSGSSAGGSSQDAMAAVRATITHRLWLLAVLLQVAGFMLHALALRFGQLTVVQPLLVCSVLFALPLNRILRGEPITRREVGWAAALVFGLAGFLIVETPPVSGATQSIDVVPAVISGTLGVVGVVVCVLVSRHARGTSPAVLGTASGIMFTGQAALLKSSVGLLNRGPLALAESWQPYVLLAVGLGGVVFSQLAFRSGPLSASLPLVVTVNPVLGVLVGALVYDEAVRDSGPALALEVAFLALLVAATLVLTRLEQTANERHAEALHTPARAVDE